MELIVDNSGLNFEEQIPQRGFAWLVIFIGILLLAAEITMVLAYKKFTRMDSLAWAAFGAGGGLLSIHRTLKKKALAKYPEKYYSPEVLDKILPSMRKCAGLFLLAISLFLLSYLSTQLGFLTLAEILLGVGLSWLFIRNKFSQFKQNREYFIKQ
jgi:hypothetical protein